MNRLRNISLALSGVVLSSGVAFADSYADMSTALEGHLTSATTIVGTLAIAGLGIFAIIWGIRKFKSAVRAGA